VLHKQQQASGRVLVTFRLPTAVRAERVDVVGEFNAWSHVAHLMIRNAEGLVAEVELEGGRRYRFRYLLDGEVWANDWAADDYVANDFGGNDDSVIDLVMVSHPGDRSI
jgi:1,4-alpha-glucan branching enzyme